MFRLKLSVVLMSVKQKIVTNSKMGFTWFFCYVRFGSVRFGWVWFDLWNVVWYSTLDTFKMCTRIDVHCSCKRFNTFSLIDHHNSVFIFIMNDEEMKQSRFHSYMRILIAFEWCKRLETLLSKEKTKHFFLVFDLWLKQCDKRIECVGWWFHCCLICCFRWESGLCFFFFFFFFLLSISLHRWPFNS